VYNIIGATFQSQGNLHKGMFHAGMKTGFCEDFFGEKANYEQKESSEGAILRIIALKSCTSGNYTHIYYNNNEVSK